MRIFTMLMIFTFIHATAFALSCPNNGSMLDTGYSISQVIQLCGEPVSKNTYTRTTILSSEWSYYKTASNNTNTKLTILFDRNAVSNINVLLSGQNEQNVKSSSVCGMNIQVGSSMQSVQSACGAPFSKKTLNTMDVQVTEFTYQANNKSTLVFENDSLVDWK